jgi:hypothetical protein
MWYWTKLSVFPDDNRRSSATNEKILAQLTGGKFQSSITDISCKTTYNKITFKNIHLSSHLVYIKMKPTCKPGESYSAYSQSCVRSCKDGYERLYPNTECLKECDNETQIRNPVTRRCRTIDMFAADDTNKASALYGFKSNRSCGSTTKSGDPCIRKVTSGLHCYQHNGMQKNGTSPAAETHVKRVATETRKKPITTKPRTCASKKKNLRDKCTRKTNCMFCWQHGYYQYGETDRTCGYKVEEDVNGMLVPISPWIMFTRACNWICLQYMYTNIIATLKMVTMYRISALTRGDAHHIRPVWKSIVDKMIINNVETIINIAIEIPPCSHCCACISFSLYLINWYT